MCRPVIVLDIKGFMQEKVYILLFRTSVICMWQALFYIIILHIINFIDIIAVKNRFISC